MLLIQCLSLSTLFNRRKQSNLMFLSKLINDEVGVSALLSKVNSGVPAFYFRNIFPFRIPFSNCNYLTNRTIVRIMKLANKDPSIISF